MSQKIETIAISDLELDKKNFRFPEKTSQRDSLYTIIDSKSAKTKAVLQSIADEGYFLDEHLYVVPQKGKKKYTVIEGNRRLASLMALHEPDRVEKSKHHTFIKRLSNHAKAELPLEIPCVVFSTLKACFKRIQLRHGLDNKGAGKVDWEAIQKDRFDKEANPKEPKPLLTLVEHIYKQKWIPESAVELLEEEGLVPNYTTLERVFNSKPARELLQITQEDYLTHSLTKPAYEKVLELVFCTIALGEKFEGVGYDSRSLNTSVQIRTFLEAVIEAATPKKGKAASKSHETESGGSSAAGNGKDGDKERSGTGDDEEPTKKGSKYKSALNLIPAHFEAGVITSVKNLFKVF